ncbi:hypothetical protein WA026_001578 [Henosepilachna vigintioctopunctata]|uniref:Trichohyalin-plectin-homology domain-containing protein n=1 Tax=Henosepilachna vigintioctopunctata TaxID=420089 RepID=A0AAW1ULL4_9CUCU
MKIQGMKPGTECLVKVKPKEVTMIPVEKQIFEYADVCLLSEEKMLSIKNWLTRNEKQKKDKERDEAYFKYLKENNFKLVGGKTIVKEEALKRLIAKKNGDIEKKLRESCERIKENKKLEREEIIKKHRRLHLINKSPNAALTSALKFSAALFERQKHYDLQQQIKEEEKKWKQMEHEQLVQQVKIAEDKEKQEENNRLRKIQEVKNCLKIQCEENAKKKQEEYLERTKREKEDYMKSCAEWEQIQKLEQEKKLRKKRENLASLKEAAEKVHLRKINEKRDDEEIYRVNEVINNSKALRDCQAREKLKKEKLERIRKNVDAAIEYQAGQALLRQKEEEIFQNAIYKYEEEYDRKHKENIDRLKAQAVERRQNYLEDMKRQKERERETSELKRMELIERYKKDEAMKYFDEMSKEKEKEKKRTYRQDIIQQALEIKETKQREKKLEDNYVLSTLSKKDDIFAEYAEEIMKYAQDRDWPTFPIKKAIQDYNKKQHIVFKKPSDLTCKN